MVDVIIRRWENLTGKKAELVKDRQRQVIEWQEEDQAKQMNG